MMTLVTILVTLILLALLLFGIVYPIWAIVQCATSVLSNVAKAIWIVVMIIFWPIGSFVYGLFASSKRVFQWISGSAFAFIILIVISFSFLMMRLFNNYSDNLRQQLSVLNEPTLSTDTISKEQLMKLNESLLTLDQEMKESSLKNFEHKMKILSLTRLFEVMTQDKKITVDEYQDWIKKFERRHELAFQEFEESLKDQDLMPLPNLPPVEDSTPTVL